MHAEGPASFGSCQADEATTPTSKRSKGEQAEAKCDWLQFRVWGTAGAVIRLAVARHGVEALALSTVGLVSSGFPGQAPDSLQSCHPGMQYELSSCWGILTGVETLFRCLT